MSGRAVRKALQRQREAELLRSATDTPQEAEESSEDEPQPPPKQSLFALLGGDDDDDDGTHDDDDDEPEETIPEPVSTGKKKKKKKKKKKAAAAAADDKGKAVEGEDEIDRALRQLNLSTPATPGSEATETQKPVVHSQQLAQVLKVDTRNLDAEAEMRRLFGKAALKDERANQRRAPGGRGLVGAGRKNPFVQAQDGWPNAGSGGLGMEIVSSTDGDFGHEAGVTEFAYVHNRAYQDVQRQFVMAVMSMDQNRLVLHLQHNPYHITTLLQVSDITHHQRDFAVSGELLERALFSLGRSLHSSFAPKLADGLARLSFRRPENRELFLTCWRYIKSLAQRGTWRTACEFAHLLLALDPFGDPYEITTLVDFLALKARQPTRLLEFIEHPALAAKHKSYPNLAFSAALAHLQLGSEAAALEYATKAITRFPWVPSALYSAIDATAKLPPALWAARPPEASPRQALLAALYAERAKDLWKDPPAAQLLVTAASAIYNLPSRPLLAADDGTVPQSLARHVILVDNPDLLSHIPAEVRNNVVAFDPLPPEDSIVSYELPDPTRVGGAGGEGVDAAVEQAFYNLPEAQREGLMREWMQGGAWTAGAGVADLARFLGERVLGLRNRGEGAEGREGGEGGDGWMGGLGRGPPVLEEVGEGEWEARLEEEEEEEEEMEMEARPA
ncbi:transcription factor 25 [Geopyxis carbonaria]|nr:transcription factor 25 [Geopyxis carbonaria]